MMGFSENTAAVIPECRATWGLLDAIPIPALIVDRQTLQIRFANHIFCQTVDCPKEAVQQQPLASLSIWRDLASKKRFLSLIRSGERLTGIDFLFGIRGAGLLTARVFSNPLTDHPPCQLITLIDRNCLGDRRAASLQDGRFQTAMDALTQIPSRQYLLAWGEQSLRQALSCQHPLSLIMFVLDGLKSIRDSYGRGAGDQVLSQFARKVGQNIREEDLFGRFDEDEFLLLLPQTGHSEAERIASRLKQFVFQSPLLIGHNHVSCSVDIGIAGIQSAEDKIGDLIKRAEADLSLDRQNNFGGTSLK